MELFTMDGLIALLSIIVIDLTLAGDNALVIGMAARKLHKTQQKRVIWYGTFGAVVLRLAAAFIVVWLLKIPGLLLGGGLVLIWIAYQLLVDHKDHNEIKPASSLWIAVRTIIIADAVMGLDNVLAVAGAAQGHFTLIVIGLLISIPIVVWGSLLIVKLVERYSWIMYIGSGVLAFTAAKMITGEKFIKPLFEDHIWMKYGFEVLMVVAVMTVGYAVKQKLYASQKDLPGMMPK